MKLECYGASRSRDGQPNEDAFWIQRPACSVAALCDGAGHAQRCASRVVQLFARQIESGTLAVERFPAWKSWLTSMDATLAGGAQTTFVGVAAIGDRLVGAYAGDSRAYLVNEQGCRLLNEDRCRRLGSGDAEPKSIHERLASRDTVLLMSDGAWTLLALTAIHRAVMANAMRHLSDLPLAFIELAGKTGRLDDMTVVALRAR